MPLCSPGRGVSAQKPASLPSGETCLVSPTPPFPPPSKLFFSQLSLPRGMTVPSVLYVVECSETAPASFRSAYHSAHRSAPPHLLVLLFGTPFGLFFATLPLLRGLYECPCRFFVGNCSPQYWRAFLWVAPLSL